MDQRSKNLPAKKETQQTLVGSQVQEDSLEEAMTMHSSILAWKIPWTEEPWRTTIHRVAKNRTRLSTHRQSRRCINRLVAH